MPKKQTRRCVSIRGELYDRLKKYCQKNGYSMSQAAEAALHDLLAGRMDMGAQLAQHELADDRSPHPREDRFPETNLHKGEKPPELDEQTKAHRKVSDIFTF